MADARPSRPQINTPPGPQRDTRRQVRLRPPIPEAAAETEATTRRIFNATLEARLEEAARAAAEDAANRVARAEALAADALALQPDVIPPRPPAPPAPPVPPRPSGPEPEEEEHPPTVDLESPVQDVYQDPDATA